jgi:hypothetical protein
MGKRKPEGKKTMKTGVGGKQDIKEGTRTEGVWTEVV